MSDEPVEGLMCGECGHIHLVEEMTEAPDRCVFCGVGFTHFTTIGVVETEQELAEVEAHRKRIFGTPEAS